MRDEVPERWKWITIAQPDRKVKGRCQLVALLGADNVVTAFGPVDPLA